MRKPDFLPVLALVLVILQMSVILFSWIISSVEPSLPIRSLLSGEGIRWFFGSFTANMAQPLLVWMLVCAVAWGVFSDSGMRAVLSSLKRHEHITLRQRYALIAVGALLVLIVISVCLLTFIPHAALLGVTGMLYPSAFIDGLIPMLAFSVAFLSVVYGMLTERFTDIKSVFTSLCTGLRTSAPFFPVYVLAVQLYYSVVFVLF